MRPVFSSSLNNNPDRRANVLLQPLYSAAVLLLVTSGWGGSEVRVWGSIEEGTSLVDADPQNIRAGYFTQEEARQVYKGDGLTGCDAEDFNNRYPGRMN